MHQIQGLSLAMDGEGGFLSVTGRGSATLADFHAAIEAIAATAREEAQSCVLIDLRAVQQSLAFSDHLMMGARIAERLAFARKVATVVPEQYRSGASEKAAQKTGLKLRAFTDRDEAQRWLEAVD